MSYFLSKDYKQTGPFSIQEIENMLDDGRISLDYYACEAGSSAWVPIAEILDDDDDYDVENSICKKGRRIIAINPNDRRFLMFSKDDGNNFEVGCMANENDPSEYFVKISDISEVGYNMILAITNRNRWWFSDNKGKTWQLAHKDRPFLERHGEFISDVLDAVTDVFFKK